MWVKIRKILLREVAWVVSSALFGLVATLLGWLFLPGGKIEIGARWVGFSIFIAILLITIVFRLAKLLAEREVNTLPGIIGTRTIQSGNTAQVICLLRYSPLFSNGTFTSIYHTDEEGFEILIGYGHVTYIRENKHIQVEIDFGLIPHRELIEGLQRNDLTVIKRVTFKPSMPLVEGLDIFEVGGDNAGKKEKRKTEKTRAPLRSTDNKPN